MSRAAWVIAWVVATVGNVCLIDVIGADVLWATIPAAAAWTFMTVFIVAAVDESVRN